MDIDLYINDAGEGSVGTGVAYFGIYFYNSDKTQGYSYIFDKLGTLGNTPNVVQDGDNIQYTSNFTSDYFNQHAEDLSSDYYLRFYSIADYAEGGAGITKAETTFDLIRIRKYSDTLIIPAVGNEENNPSLVVDFTSSIQFGYAPLDVNFTDLSQGSPTIWEWDFNNDGTIDSYAQNPLYTFTSSGLYDVELKVFGHFRVDSLLIQNCIMVQGTQLDPPQNPTIIIIGNDAVLGWDPVVNADYYLIYISEDPYGSFEFLDYSSSTAFTHTGIILQKDKIFYEIIGFDGTMRELTGFIDQNKRKNLNLEIIK